MLPMARALGLGVTAWAPLAAGLLTGKYSASERGKGRLDLPDWAISEDERGFAKKFDSIAHRIGRTPSQVALNWVRQQEGVVIPIVGTTSPSQMKENLGCLDFQLTSDQLKQLGDMSRIELGFPYEFLGSKDVKGFIFRDTFDLIDK